MKTITHLNPITALFAGDRLLLVETNKFDSFTYRVEHFIPAYMPFSYEICGNIIKQVLRGTIDL